MARISNERYFLTPAQRAEVIKKQREREPEQVGQWEEERKRQIAAEKERGRYDCSLFLRLLNRK